MGDGMTDSDARHEERAKVARKKREKANEVLNISREIIAIEVSIAAHEAEIGPAKERLQQLISKLEDMVNG